MKMRNDMAQMSEPDTNQEEHIIRENQAVQVYESRFIKVYDLQYAPGRHYYDATRREAADLLAIKPEEEFKRALPDAVSMAVILDVEGEEPRLYLTKEYRYPAGRFLLSIPAGLIDALEQSTAAHTELTAAIYSTAIRELREETGMVYDAVTDEISMVNPLLLSSPGMTDESNAFVKVVLHREKMPAMSQDGAVGAEVFDGVQLITREEAKKILQRGTDEEGIFYSVFTWIALMIFVSEGIF